MAGSCAGRVALITGASRGIGKALAIRLASEGAALGLVSRSIDTETFGSSMRDTLEQLDAMGARAVPVAADLGDPAQSRESIVDAVEAELGPVDILVNNAMSSPYKFFADFTDDEIRFAQEVNVWAPWQLTRRVLPGMRERGHGWILNMSSGSAEIPGGPPYSELVGLRGTVYGGTKAMLNRWTVSLALELDGLGGGREHAGTAEVDGDGSGVDVRREGAPPRRGHGADRDDGRGRARAVRVRPGRAHRTGLLQPQPARPPATTGVRPPRGVTGRRAGNPPTSPPASRTKFRVARGSPSNSGLFGQFGSEPFAPYDRETATTWMGRPPVRLRTVMVILAPFWAVHVQNTEPAAGSHVPNVYGFCAEYACENIWVIASWLATCAAACWLLFCHATNRYLA